MPNIEGCVLICHLCYLSYLSWSPGKAYYDWRGGVEEKAAALARAQIEEENRARKRRWKILAGAAATALAAWKSTSIINYRTLFALLPFTSAYLTVLYIVSISVPALPPPLVSTWFSSGSSSEEPASNEAVARVQVVPM